MKPPRKERKGGGVVGGGAANGAGGDGEGGSGTATVNNSDGESDSQVHFLKLKPPSYKTRFKCIKFMVKISITSSPSFFIQNKHFLVS